MPKTFEEAVQLYDLVYRSGNAKHPRKGLIGRYGEHTSRDPIIVEKVKEVFGDEKVKILDASCGRGHLLRELLALGYDAEGTEISPFVLKNDLADLPVKLLGYHQLRELGHEQYDVVVSSDVLEHLLSEADVEEAVKSLCYISKGYLIISVGIVPARNFPEALPDTIGQITRDMHCVVRKPAWWKDLFSKYIHVEWEIRPGRRVYFCAGKKKCE